MASDTAPTGIPYYPTSPKSSLPLQQQQHTIPSRGRYGGQASRGYGYNDLANGGYDGPSNGGLISTSPGFRSATPNSKGQYSAALLDVLEGQHEQQLGSLGQKVKILKDLTLAIGDEVRSSSSLMDIMNNQYEAARARSRGTIP